MGKETTKRVIAYAFKELLLEKPINKITVSDIAEKCDINRQTFYYHFHDIIELTEYSKMPDEIKVKYPETKFVEYEDWTSTVRND